MDDTKRVLVASGRMGQRQSQHPHFPENLDRWGWCGNREILNTANYSMRRRELTTSNHALFQITATYTFGFGKKVERGNEASQLQGAGSAILQ